MQHKRDEHRREYGVEDLRSVVDRVRQREREREGQCTAHPGEKRGEPGPDAAKHGGHQHAVEVFNYAVLALLEGPEHNAGKQDDLSQRSPQHVEVNVPSRLEDQRRRDMPDTAGQHAGHHEQDRARHARPLGENRQQERRGEQRDERVDSQADAARIQLSEEKSTRPCVSCTRE